jgi:hypothetical protein
MNAPTEPRRHGLPSAPVVTLRPIMSQDATLHRRATARMMAAAVVCGHDPMGCPEAKGRCRDVVPDLIIELL